MANIQGEFHKWAFRWFRFDLIVLIALIPVLYRKRIYHSGIDRLLFQEKMFLQLIRAKIFTARCKTIR